jgi:competence protein ComGF
MKSKLTLLKIMLVTYDILLKVLSLAIQQEYQIDQRTACDWFQFCREMVLEFVESKSEKLLKWMTANKEKENTTGVTT